MTFLFARGGHPLAGRSEKPVPKLKVFGQLGEANALSCVVYAFLIGGHVAILLAVDHRRERDQSLSHRRLLLVPLMMETDLATIFSSRRGGFLPVDPLHLLGEYEPTGRYLFECALYGQVPCLRRAMFGVVRSLSVPVRSL